MRFEWKTFDSQRLSASQQGFDERFEFVHAPRGLEAFHDVALAVDHELREVPTDVTFRALLRLQEFVQRDLLVAVHVAFRHLRERGAVAGGAERVDLLVAAGSLRAVVGEERDHSFAREFGGSLALNRHKKTGESWFFRKKTASSTVSDRKSYPRKIKWWRINLTNENNLHTYLI